MQTHLRNVAQAYPGHQSPILDDPIRTILLVLIGLLVAPAIWLYAACVATANGTNVSSHVRRLRAITTLSYLLALCALIEIVLAWVSAFRACTQYVSQLIPNDTNASTVKDLGTQIKNAAQFFYCIIFPVVVVCAVLVTGFYRFECRVYRTFPHTAWLVYVFWSAANAASCIAYKIGHVWRETMTGQQNDELDRLIMGKLKISSGLSIALLTVGAGAWLEGLGRAMAFKFLLFEPERQITEEEWLEDDLLM